MKIILLTSKTCHFIDVEKVLNVLGLSYERFDVEDQPELIWRFNVRHCPTLIVDDQKVIPIDENNAAQLRQLLTAD